VDNHRAATHWEVIRVHAHLDSTSREVNVKIQTSAVGHHVPTVAPTTLVVSLASVHLASIQSQEDIAWRRTVCTASLATHRTFPRKVCHWREKIPLSLEDINPTPSNRPSTPADSLHSRERTEPADAMVHRTLCITILNNRTVNKRD
jgi:hypothetical protein